MQDLINYFSIGLSGECMMEKTVEQAVMPHFEVPIFQNNYLYIKLTDEYQRWMNVGVPYLKPRANLNYMMCR